MVAALALAAGEPARRLSEEHAEFHGPDWASARPRWPSWRTARSWSCGERGARPHRRGRARRWAAHRDRPAVRRDRLGHRPHGTALWLGATASRGPRSGGPRRRRRGPVRRPCDAVLADADIAVAEPFSFVSEHDRVVHACSTRPRWADGRPGGEWPPLVVACHGGPTAGARPGFNPLVQFFTTRGFAVVDVDYAGSSGYGRAYRRSLAGGWGVVDVADCIDTAAFLAMPVSVAWRTRRVDGRRMAIRGGVRAASRRSRPCAERPFAACASGTASPTCSRSCEHHDFEARYTTG